MWWRQVRVPICLVCFHLFLQFLKLNFYLFIFSFFFFLWCLSDIRVSVKHRMKQYYFVFSTLPKPLCQGNSNRVTHLFRTCRTNVSELTSASKLRSMLFSWLEKQRQGVKEMLFFSCLNEWCHLHSDFAHTMSLQHSASTVTMVTRLPLTDSAHPKPPGSE